MRVGVISDTHGLLRPEALKALQAAEHILHAGDVGDPSILDDLRSIAPVTAIRRNIYMLHDVQRLDLNPEAAGISAVVSGHSHKPLVERRRGVLFLNPGSAGPRRFQLPVTLAWLQVEPDMLTAQIVDLDI